MWPVTFIPRTICYVSGGMINPIHCSVRSSCGYSSSTYLQNCASAVADPSSSNIFPNIIRTQDKDCIFSSCQLWQQSWTSSLELSASGPQTVGLVLLLFQTVAGDFYWVSGTKMQCKPTFKLHFGNLFTYLGPFLQLSDAIVLTSVAETCLNVELPIIQSVRGLKNNY